MSALTHIRKNATTATRPVSFALTLALGLGLVTAVATGQTTSAAPGAHRFVTVGDDDTIVLPSRVAAAIARTQGAFDRSTAEIDEHRNARANRSLTALKGDLRRSYRAALRQLNAAAPVDAESEAAETTAGPDSVAAVLTLDQTTVTGLAGLFDGVQNPGVVKHLNGSLSAALTKRGQLLDAVLALDPEGAGADYADAMADTVDGYTDETANLAEALKDDRLTPAGRTALTKALARSKAATAKITAAFGGGE